MSTPEEDDSASVTTKLNLQSNKEKTEEAND
jgi:hypothetical protein